MDTEKRRDDKISRRDFVKRTAAGAAGLTAGMMASGNFAYAAGSDTMRVGLIGCGGRGTGAAADSVNAAPGVEIAAMGDLFRDRLDASRSALEQEIGDKLAVTDDRCFSGFDAYQRVLETDVDYVILATPPGFRPIHMRAAIEAGKHVFAEKPVAVDAVGARSVMATADLADQKGLAIAAGTQNRHDPEYVETVRRIHDGAIGEVVSASIIRHQQGVWLRERKPGMSDMEWQCRNWYYFTWLSGDGIVEQHIHHVDFVNWVLQSVPVKVVGVGGRQRRVDPSYGHIYDNFGNEMVYPNGVRVNSQHRHWEGGDRFSGERELVIGTKGRATPGRIEGENNWQYEGEAPSAYVLEHTNLIESIRSGEPVNEGRTVAESSLTAIMARETAYTGQEITWDMIAEANLDLVPETFEFGPAPFPPVATPGKTRLNRTRRAYIATASE